MNTADDLTARARVTVQSALSSVQRIRTEQVSCCCYSIIIVVTVVSFTLRQKRVGLFFHVRTLAKRTKMAQKKLRMIYCYSNYSFIVHLNGRPKSKEWCKTKGPLLCWPICNRGKKMIDSIENGIQIAAWNTDRCQQASSRITAIHFSRAMRSLNRGDCRIYILFNQVAHFCIKLWNTHSQLWVQVNRAVHSALHSSISLKKNRKNQIRTNWNWLFISVLHHIVPKIVAIFTFHLPPLALKWCHNSSC